jgi:hypothetical protein
MSWLIESYEAIDEAPINDYMHTSKRAYNKLRYSGKVTDKDEKDLASDSVLKRMRAAGKIGALSGNASSKAANDPGVKQAIEHKYGKDHKSLKNQIKDYKAMRAGDQATTDKVISKANDILVAKDAKDRHERRHPELKKATNETAWIVESLQ